MSEISGPRHHSGDGGKNLAGLLERVETESGPDRGLDGMVARDLLGWLPYFDLDGGRILDWHKFGGHWHLPGDPCDNRHPVSQERNPDPPLYTASVDAVLALIEKKLPGWHWGVDTMRRDGKCRGRLAQPVETEYGPGIGMRADKSGATPALALLAALIKALMEPSPPSSIPSDASEGT